MGEVPSLKFCARTLCIQDLLELTEDGNAGQSGKMLQYLTTGYFSSVSGDILRRIVEYYPEKMTSTLLQALVPEHARELSLSRCTLLSPLKTTHVLKDLKHLQKLDLSHCGVLIQPEVFQYLGLAGAPVSYLSLEDCSTVDDKVVKSVLRNLRQLQHLNISECPKLTEKVFDLREESTTEKDPSLKVRDNQPQCSLVSVDISCCNEISDISIQDLMLLTGKTLRHLNMAWTRVTPLSLLCVSGCCLPASTFVEDDVELTRNLLTKFISEDITNHSKATQTEASLPTTRDSLNDSLDEEMKEFHVQVSNVQQEKPVEKILTVRDLNLEFQIDFESHQDDVQYLEQEPEADLSVNLLPEDGAEEEDQANSQSQTETEVDSGQTYAETETEDVKTETGDIDGSCNTISTELAEVNSHKKVKEEDACSCMMNKGAMSVNTENLLSQDKDIRVEDIEVEFSAGAESVRNNTCDRELIESKIILDKTIECTSTAGEGEDDILVSQNTDNADKCFSSGPSEHCQENKDKQSSYLAKCNLAQASQTEKVRTELLSNNVDTDSILGEDATGLCESSGDNTVEYQCEQSESKPSLSTSSPCKNEIEGKDKIVNEDSNSLEERAEFSNDRVDRGINPAESSTEANVNVFEKKSCSMEKQVEKDVDAKKSSEDIKIQKLFGSDFLSVEVGDFRCKHVDFCRLCFRYFILKNSRMQKFSISWTEFDDSCLNCVSDNLHDLVEVSLVGCHHLTTRAVLKLGCDCAKLRKVNLHGVSFIHDVAVMPFMKTGNLVSLNLAECNVTDVVLIRLTRSATCELEKLDLSWCEELEERGLNVLCGKESDMQSLSLRQLPATNLTLALIAENFRCLREINLSSVQQINTESIINLARNLRLLECADLSWNTGITNDGIKALLLNCTLLKTAILSGLKLLTSAPFLSIISDLQQWRRCKALLQYKHKERVAVREMGEEQLSSDEEYEDLYVPYRSKTFAANLKSLFLEYCDSIDDEQMQEIVAVCRGSLRVVDYYSENVKPILLRPKKGKIHIAVSDL